MICETTSIYKPQICFVRGSLFGRCWIRETRFEINDVVIRDYQFFLQFCSNLAHKRKLARSYCLESSRIFSQLQKARMIKLRAKTRKKVRNLNFNLDPLPNLKEKQSRKFSCFKSVPKCLKATVHKGPIFGSWLFLL